jgi:hypothetical protein
MRRRRMAATVAALGAAVMATVALVSAAASAPERAIGPPASRDPSVPRLAEDRGAGERLLLVVGGAFGTRAEAERANEAIRIGDLQGFYVASTDQFVGLERVLGDADGEFVLVSAFRTGRGAREFLDLVRVAGAAGFITPRLENLGFEYVGLGQEANPDGTGPLTEPIPGLTT